MVAHYRSNRPVRFLKTRVIGSPTPTGSFAMGLTTEGHHVPIDMSTENTPVPGLWFCWTRGWSGKRVRAFKTIVELAEW